MSISAKFEADFSAFQSAVQTAQVKLRTFEDDSNKVAASLTRMGNSFSGTRIISDATLMSEAVARAGGASKLTASEMERVNATVTEAIAKYTALGKVAPQSMVELADATKKAETPTDALNVSFGKLVASYVTAQAIIGTVKGAFNAFVGEIKSSVTAANEAEKANVQMVAALRAQGTAVPSVISAFQGYASALQQTTVYQDDAIEGAIALLVQVGGVMPRDMEKALQATTNLASGLGKDLTSATMLVAKAAEGNTGALRKAGVVIDETKAKQEGFGYILDQITEKFGGQAAAIAGTYEGRLQQLGNTWNNVEESIGRVITQNSTLLTAFDLLNQAIASNTGELNTNNAANEAVSFAVIGAAKSVSVFLQALDYIQTAYGGLRAGSDLLIRSFLNIGIAVLDTATAIGTYTKYVNPVAWTSMWANGMREIADQSTFLKGAVQGLTADSQAAIAKSNEWGNSIQGLKGKIDRFTEDLEETRGKTVQLKTATDQGTDAWDRHTTAVGKGSTAVDEHARKLAAVNLKILEASRDIGNLTTNQQASVLALKALGLSTDDVAVKLGVSAVAVGRFDEAMKDLRRSVDAAEGPASMLTVRTLALGEALQLAGTKLPRPELRDLSELSIRAATDVAALSISVDELGRMGVFGSGQIQNLNTQIGVLPNVIPGATAAIKDAATGIVKASDATKLWGVDLDGLARTFTQLAQVSDGAMGEVARSLGQVIVAMKLAKESGERFRSALASIRAGDTAGGYVQLGASIAGAVGALDSATASGGTTERALRGAAAGAAAGSAVFPGFGTAIGAGVGALVGWYRGAKAAREETEKWRGVIRDFERQLRSTLSVTQLAEAGNREWAATTIAVRDAYLATGRSAADAERDVAALWAAAERGGPAAQAAIDLVNQAFIELQEHNEAIQESLKGLGTVIEEVGVGIPEFLQPLLDDLMATPGLTDDVRAALGNLVTSSGPDFAKLEEMAKKYGGSIEQLGPAFQQAHVTADAKQWITDFEKLEAAGADVNGVLGFMADEASDVVQESIKFGTTIPENMRPMLERLITMGLLLDASGNKITDINGLRFGPAVETDIDRLAHAIDALVGAITGISPQFQELKNKLKEPIDPIHVKVVFDVPPVPALRLPSITGPSVPGARDFGVSSRSLVLPFVPRLSAPVLTTARISSGGSAGSTGTDASVAKVIARLERTLDDLPRAIGVKVVAASVLRRAS